MSISTVKATINSVQHSLTYNGTSGKWEATLTAPAGSSFNLSGGFYDVEVEVKDSATNTLTVDSTHVTLGNYLKLVVKEKVVPTISIVSPGASAYIITNTPTITFQLRDADSGVKISTLQLKIDGGSGIAYNATGMTCTPVSGGYDCSYVVQSALSDGSHTITINIADNDGNSATQASRTFTVDTIAPTLNVTAPAEGYEINVAGINVIGSTNDATSSPVVVDIKLNSVDQGTVTLDGSGNFNKTITLAEGANVIVIKSTDAAGKTTSITRNVTLDSTPPTITSIEIIPNPVDGGQTYVIKVTVND